MKSLDKRADIMQAALKLITERGFHDAPMSEISEKAGVAAGTIYTYFTNKEVLIAELHQELAEKILAHIQKSYPVEQPLRERFLCLIRELIRYFIAHPLHFRYMEQYFNSPYGISLHRDKFSDKSGNKGILMDIFEQGVEQQVLKDFPKAALFSLALGPVIFLMRDHSLGFITLDDSLIEKITETCWESIKR
ncbi:MAG: TetR/AcrR family transcriptional regulator [Smithellaceae bacterium]